MRMPLPSPLTPSARGFGRLPLSRRAVLAGGSALGLSAAGLASRPARAAAASDLKFVFVFNTGGWDPTRVFVDAFDNRAVAMEPGAARATTRGLPWVDHPARPAVRAFVEANAADMLVINGLQVRSIAHEICTMIALTGDTSGFKPDFATIIANDQAARYTLPHLVLGGPSFTGALGTAVARTGSNGQLEGLLSGEIVGYSDSFTAQLPPTSLSSIDRFLGRRAGARAVQGRSAADRELAASLLAAHEKAVDLRGYRYVMDFTTDGTIESQAAVAVDALSVGLSRCVSLSFPNSGGLSWDSHGDNDATQSALFEGLFGGLAELMALLRSTPGSSATTLADETVVVVQSEMGRTPNLNPANGKDHWPYTSMMLLGPGLTTNRVVGALNDGYVGELIDLETAEVDPGGRTLSAESIGAALLAMADIDPAAHVDGADPLLGVLA
jgi:hypothetical protein